MAKKKAKKAPKIAIHKEPKKIEKITEVPLGPSNLELQERIRISERAIVALEVRFNSLVTAISNSKSLKGI